MNYSIADRGRFKVIDIDGDVENDVEARTLTAEISRLAEDGHYNFCFNLANATYLNSSGISIFIHSLAETEAHKGSVFMIVTESQVRNVVELAGLDKLIKTYPTMEEFEKEQL